MRLHTIVRRSVVGLALPLVLAGCGGGAPATSTAVPPLTTSSPLASPTSLAASPAASATAPPVATSGPLPSPTPFSASPATTISATTIAAPGTSPAGTPIATASSAVVVGDLAPLRPWPTPDSAQFDADGDGLLTWDEYVMAARAAFSAFDWPPTYVITVDTVLSAIPPQVHADKFQPGTELNNIGSWNQCAWAMTWIDSRQSGDAPLGARELFYLVNVMPGAVNDDYSRQFITDMSDKAALGDPSGVMQFIKANSCETMITQKAAP